MRLNSFDRSALDRYVFSDYKSYYTSLCALYTEKIPPSGESTMADMEDRWLSVDEITHYLGVSSDTIYRWITPNRFGVLA